MSCIETKACLCVFDNQQENEECDVNVTGWLNKEWGEREEKMRRRKKCKRFLAELLVVCGFSFFLFLAIVFFSLLRRASSWIRIQKHLFVPK